MRIPGLFWVIAEEFRILMSGHFKLLDHDVECVRIHRGKETIFFPQSPIYLQLQVQEQNIRERECRRHSSQNRHTKTVLRPGHGFCCYIPFLCCFLFVIDV